MFNDGNGIDIAKHPEHDIGIPEMIFSHLRASTNYDKTENKLLEEKTTLTSPIKLCYYWLIYEQFFNLHKIEFLML